MVIKVDYLTLSIIPSFVVDPTDFFMSLVKFFELENEFFQFKQGSGHGFYSYSFSYKNIVFSVPEMFDSDRQGFCISFSGQGVDFYLEHMRRKHPDYSIKDLLRAFLALAEDGNCRCNVSRIDLAVDDITYKSKNEKPLLNMEEIRNSIMNCEIVSPFAIKRQIREFTLTFHESQRTKISGILGNTIYLGSKKSDTFVRIYDKIAEREANKVKIDDDIDHWIRFEIVFKHDNALSIAQKIVTLSDIEFSLFFSEVVNNYVRFIDVTEKNISNYSRCPSKKWWVNFIGTVRKRRLYHVKPSENAFDRSLRWQKKSVFPTISAMLLCMPVQQYLMMIKKEVSNSENSFKRQNEIITDFINNDKHSPHLEGFERYSQYIEDDEYRDFLLELRKDRDYNRSAAVETALKKAKMSNDIL